MVLAEERWLGLAKPSAVGPKKRLSWELFEEDVAGSPCCND